MAHPQISGTCLCGAVSVTHSAPEKLVSCNCSACRRYRALWAHGGMDQTTVRATGPVTRYTRPDGDGDLIFVSCATCGVTTHWEPKDPEAEDAYMAINAALCDPAQLEALPVRRFDGADSWTFLD